MCKGNDGSLSLQRLQTNKSNNKLAMHLTNRSNSTNTEPSTDNEITVRLLAHHL